MRPFKISEIRFMGKGRAKGREMSGLHATDRVKKPSLGERSVVVTFEDVEGKKRYPTVVVVNWVVITLDFGLVSFLFSLTQTTGLSIC
jgi:hypothetical protein